MFNIGIVVTRLSNWKSVLPNPSRLGEIRPLSHRQFFTSIFLNQATSTQPKEASPSFVWTKNSRRSGVVAVKRGMTVLWDQWGVRIPVTILQLEKLKVIQTKTIESDGYFAVQVGYGERKPHRVGMTVVGHCKAYGAQPKAKICEFRITEDAMLQSGQEINASHFLPGQFIDVSSTSIGKGFQGVMKRWGYKGQPATRGISVTHRHGGSTGQCQDPGRVFKNKKMAGRMGGKKVTVQNLQVVKIDTSANVLYLKGSVPGHDGQYIRVRDSLKKSWKGKLAPEASQIPFPTSTSHVSHDEMTLPKMSEKDPWLAYKHSAN